MKNRFLKLWHQDGTRSVMASVLSILVGLIAGSLIILIVGLCTPSLGLKSVWDGVRLIFGGLFATGRDAAGALTFGFNPASVGNMLFRATPLILTGLSVAVAFKTGLFNIGAPGQYLAGTAATLFIALSIPSSVVPPEIIWFLAFFGGMLAGALWGAIPGMLKSLLNINEVLACIMTNWIAANLVTWLFDKGSLFESLQNHVENTKTAYIYKTSFNGVETAKLGLDKLFPNSQVNGGILIAIGIAILIYILMNKTTLGYELKACGANRHAARYAAEHRPVHGHRRGPVRRGRLPVLPVWQHGVFLVYLPDPSRHRLQWHSRGPAGRQQSHRCDLYRMLHVHAGYCGSAAYQPDGLQ